MFSSFFDKVATNLVQVDAVTDFYAHSFRSINGVEVDFARFKGRKVLIVNTASKCGFTPQFEGLEELNKRYGDRLVVIGFPSNDFGRQDPGSNTAIQGFCTLNYGVTFLMMEKSSVRGKDRNEVFKWLTTKSENGWNDRQPGWNFCKYLIDEQGKLIARFPSRVKPLDERITSLIRPSKDASS